MCIYFAQGKCKNGDKCQYKHAPVCNFFAKDGSCKFGDKCRFTHPKDGKAFPVKNDEQSSERQDSRAKSPPDEPDAEGSAAVAIPIGYNNGGVAFVASTSATGRGANLALRSCLKDDISRRLGEISATKKVTFGNYKQYNFTCDTMTRRYDYHPAKPPFKAIRWNCVRAEKAKWHAQLARMIANDLCREVFSGPEGLIFAVQKEILRWIIDS